MAMGISRGAVARIATLCLASSIAAAQTSVTITAHPESPGVTIPADFLGFSYETSSLASTTTFPSGSAQFQQLVSQLGPGWLRFGGNSVDHTAWIGGQRTSTTPTGSLTASDVDRVSNFARLVGWRVLFALNLATASSTTDAAEAAYVRQSAADVLYGFEIGNEPDLFAGNGNRASTYKIADFLSEWGAYAGVVQAGVPGATLTGPADAGNFAAWTTPFANQYGSRITLLTQHYYPLGPPATVGATASNAATIPNLLGNGPHNGAQSLGLQLKSLATASKIPWRMAETNSCYNGGQTGVSDVFASALWGIDYLFTVAGNASAGVNFHGGGTGAYTAIASSSTAVTARPLYYALLLFHAAARGRVVPLDLNAGGINLRAYAALDGDGTLLVVAVNMDATHDASVKITPGPAYTRAMALPLTAPTLTATSGITLGGAAVAADGSWSPADVQSLSGTAGAYSLSVPAGTAALVGFGGGPLGIGNSAGGQLLVAPNSMASAYGKNLAFAARSTPSVKLGNSLAGSTVNVTDSAGVSRPAPLIYVSPYQVNFLVPAGTAPGTATVTTAGASGSISVAPAAPGLFTMGGTKVAAATAARYPAAGGAPASVPVFDCASGSCKPVPLALDAQSTVYLTLYGTGIQGASSLAAVTCSIGGITVPVSYAGPQGQYSGFDQVNVALPAALRGQGSASIVVTVDGRASNAVEIAVGG